MKADVGFLQTPQLSQDRAPNDMSKNIRIDAPQRDSLGADADITARLDAATLDRCFDLDHQLRNVPVIFNRTLALKNW